MTEEEAESSADVGLGAHTDLQCFTLLAQDMVGGLQVLSKEGQWLNVKPIADTFVVNIGDYLMRMTNDRLKSTVHRVHNHSTVDRYSMPFFFGFNFNEKCSVLPSCTDEKSPPKYEPISCGEASHPGNGGGICSFANLKNSSGASFVINTATCHRCNKRCDS